MGTFAYFSGTPEALPLNNNLVLYEGSLCFMSLSIVTKQTFTSTLIAVTLDKDKEKILSFQT
jgi:hypothetical protein